MKSIDKVLETYGNVGVIFDFLLASIISYLLFYFNIPLSIITETGKVNDYLITFFSISLGFILTSFSILYLYDPKNSDKMQRIVNHTSYKRLLKTFVSVIFISILLEITLISYNIVEGIPPYNVNYLLLGLITFTILRTIKCIYYLYLIVDLSS